MIVRLRSLLFTPAHATTRFEKALRSAADVVIFDLEDAVAPQLKAEARQNLGALAARPDGRPIAIRVNPADTRWHLDDLEAAVLAAADLVMLPKSGGGRDLLALDGLLNGIERTHAIPEGRTRIIALAGEDAASLAALEYAGITPRLAAIALGAEDLSADLGVAARDEAGRVTPLIAHARTLIALTARRAGVAAIDTPFPDIADPDGNVREAREAVALGFVGKMCIHPAQIDAVNDAFEPAAGAVDRARRIVAAFADAPDAGVLQLDGKMIDEAHLKGARTLLARL